MAPQNQGTVALLTAGKVHILAPVARGFGRNPPCYPGDQKSQSTKVSLRTLTVSVWMKIGDWSVKTEILEETALNLSWVSSLSMCRPFDSFPIYVYCWVLPKHCKQWSLWRLGFPSLKKKHVCWPTLWARICWVPNIYQRSRACHPKMCEACPDTI